jgi:glyoxylase-like metal-dependent hydrolase (beta-lactamase superfamily II)
MTTADANTLKPVVTHFFDEPTNTFSYVVEDPSSSACAIVDSVLDFDYAAGRIGYAGADRIIAFVRERALTVEWIVETHVHADHLSAAPYLQAALGGRTGIGEHIDVVQVREERDRSLAMPRQIIPSLQVNMKAGGLPAEENNGKRYLRVPLNTL